MKSRDQATLLDIILAAQLAVSFIENLTESEFLTDRKTQSAVLYQLMIMGEAVKRLSSDFREQNPHIPWRLIAGMRDKLIHDYEGVEVNRIWLTLKTSIPDLLKALEPLLPPSEL